MNKISSNQLFFGGVKNVAQPKEESVSNIKPEEQKDICSKEAGQAMRGYRNIQTPKEKLASILSKEKVAPELAEKILSSSSEMHKRILNLIEFGNEGYASMLDFCANDEQYETFVKNATEKNETIINIAKDITPAPKLSKYDLRFLRGAMFNSQFYSPKEYLDAFLYLRDLKTEDNENILDSSTFLNKLPQHEDSDKEKQYILYNNINEILKIDPSSSEASYIQMFLELIQNGAVNKSAIRILSSANNGQEGAKLNGNWELSPKVKQDINLLSDTIAVNSDKNALQDEIKDNYIPEFESDSKALSNRKTGDVYKLKGDKFIKIKTDENKAKDLKITKDTYMKLFPPIERFSSTQQIFGDCFCIESLMTLFNDDKMRAKLLDLISEDDNGNITIEFPNYDPVVFKNGKLPQDEKEADFSSGAYGYKLLEYTYAKAMMNNQISFAKTYIPEDKIQEFEEFVDKNGENIFIYEEDGERKWTTFDDAKAKNLMNCGNLSSYSDYLLNNGGYPIDIYNKLGIDVSLCSARIEANKPVIYGYVDDMKSKEFFEKNIVHVGMGQHAYSIGINEKNGKIEYLLYNPHSQGTPLKFDNLDGLKDMIETITLAKKE